MVVSHTGLQLPHPEVRNETIGKRQSLNISVKTIERTICKALLRMTSSVFITEIFVVTPFTYSIPDVSPNADALLQRLNWNLESSGDEKFLEEKVTFA